MRGHDAVWGALSCGGGGEQAEREEVFERHLVTQDIFLSNPLDIASSHELYVSVNGHIYRSETRHDAS
jgi:hypothetical protein